MKQNFEKDILSLINKVQEQIIALDKKVDILINQSLPKTNLPPKPVVNSTPVQAKPHDHNKARVMYKAICADCQKECTIPFKPSGDRPIYCQDCFSRRKVIRLSGMKVEDKPKEAPPVQAVINKPVDIKKASAKSKKKAVPVKKTIVKKKSAPKKK